MTEDDYKYRKSYVYPVMIGALILGLWLIYDSSKTYESVDKASGIIVDKGIKKEYYRGNNVRYTFYFQLEKIDQVFGLFLGSGTNAIEKGQKYSNQLKLNQQITIYYDNNLITESEKITWLIYRIENNGKIIIDSDQHWRRIIGFISVGISLIFAWLLHWLKKKYNRELDNEPRKE